MDVTAFSSKASYLQNQRRRGKRACRESSVGVWTMKKILFATVALLAMGAAAPAVGADLGNRNYYKTPAPAYAAPIYNWTGFYVGAHLGGAFSSDNNFNGLSTGSNGNGRFLGGLQAGADWQVNPTSWSAPKPSTPGSRAASARCSRAAWPTPTTSAVSARSPAASATPGVRAWST